MNQYPSECEDSDNNIVLNPPETKKETYPTHLTCPYCPAQAYENTRSDVLWVGGFKAFQRLYQYSCPRHHKFYVEGELCP